MMTLLRNVALGALGLTAALVVVWAGQALLLAIGGPVFLGLVGWYLLKAGLAPARPMGQGRR